MAGLCPVPLRDVHQWLDNFGDSVPVSGVPHRLDPPLPADFNSANEPYGVIFVGTACCEPRLIKLAYAFE